MKVARYVSFSKVPSGRRSQGLVWLIHRPYESTQIKLIEGSRVMNRLDSWLRYNTLSISLDRTMRKTKQNEIIITREVPRVEVFEGIVFPLPSYTSATWHAHLSSG